MMQKSRGSYRRHYIIKYTLLFLVTAAIVFVWFWISGKTFIFESDGWNQHFKAYQYYAVYLRNGIRSFLETGHFVFPAWDFALGEGGDVLTALHYYVIGDPFAFFSVFVPSEFMLHFYDAMVVLRMYLAGAAFSFLCFKLTDKARNNNAVLAGSLVYVFCTWVLFSACTHVFFLNPMILLPLLVAGVEDIIRGKRPYLFFAAFAVSALCNFYFFYMLVLLVLIYIVIRLILIHGKKIRDGLKVFAKIVLWALLGCAAAAVILLPVIFAFLNDARLGASAPFSLFYKLSYYEEIPKALFTAYKPVYLSLGFAAPAVLSVLLLIKRKGNRLLKIILAVSVVFMIFPVFGQMFNGFNYQTNRWSFSLALPVAFIVVITWDSFKEMKAGDVKYLAVALGCIAALCGVIGRSRESDVFSAIVILAVFLFVAAVFRPGKNGSPRKRRIHELLCLAVVVVSIGVNAYWYYSDAGTDQASRNLEASVINEKYSDNETKVIRETVDDYGTTRFSGKNLTKNANMVTGLSSTQYYWTNSNSYINEYRTELELDDDKAYNYIGYNERAALLSLAGVKYYALKGNAKGSAPYGFKKIVTDVNTEDDWQLYENKYALPMAYAYSQYIKKENWDTLTAVDKQNAMLEAAVVDDASDRIPEWKENDECINVPYTIRGDEKDIKWEDGRIEVLKPKSEITLIFGETAPECETYVNIKGLEFAGYDEENRESSMIRFKSSLKKTASMTIRTPEDKKYNGRHDFCVCLNYTKKPVKSVVLSFQRAGIYSYDDISVYLDPMKNYKEKISSLTAADIELSYGTDEVYAQYENDRTALLCFSIPYGKGWSAEVDGEPAEILKTNIKNMGILLDSGKHTVVLRYSTPYLREGRIISAAVLAALGIFILWTEIRKRKTK